MSDEVIMKNKLWERPNAAEGLMETRLEKFNPVIISNLAEIVVEKIIGIGNASTEERRLPEE